MHVLKGDVHGRHSLNVDDIIDATPQFWCPRGTEDSSSSKQANKQTKKKKHNST